MDITYKYLTDGPCKTVTDIRKAKAKTLCAALRISFLQIVESWFTEITVFTFYIFLLKTYNIWFTSALL